MERVERERHPPAETGRYGSVRIMSFPPLSWVRLAPLLWVSWVAAATPPGQEQERAAALQEEAEDYFQKWLTQDVVYIISDQEGEVFQKLSTPEEKEQFIEQFWLRRDPDPSTAVNEFKEEHYRRIAYANERFSVGQPGWMSDRGRIYIIHGPPDQIEAHPTGGQYQRPSWQGGGWTQVYPFEIWRYRYIEGIGSEVELEFVDRSMSGQYKLALNPEEKDALLKMGLAGPTLAEIFRMSRKADRPSLNPLYRGKGFQPLRETAFERYLTYAKVQSAPAVKYRDLQELVQINVSYHDLPFRVREDYFRLDQDHVLVPITVELEDTHLSFTDADGVYSAEAAVYGVITSLGNRLVAEFEDELVTSYHSSEGRPPRGRSLYQKMVVLEDRARYKLSLVVKDLNSGRIGVTEKALVPPRFDSSRLSVSSLLLSDYIQKLEEIPDSGSMFVLGDLKIYPQPENRFSTDRPVLVYFHVYNAALDQASQSPSLAVTYRILKGEETVVELRDQGGVSVQFFSSQRLVLIQELPVAGLEAGRYRLEVRVEDEVGNEAAVSSTPFELLAPKEVRAG